MINKFYSFMALIFSLIIFQGCDDGWDFDTPGCMDENATNYYSNVTFDNGSCYSISDIFLCFSRYFIILDSDNLGRKDFTMVEISSISSDFSISDIVYNIYYFF